MPGSTESNPSSNPASNPTSCVSPDEARQIVTAKVQVAAAYLAEKLTGAKSIRPVFKQIPNSRYRFLVTQGVLRSN